MTSATAAPERRRAAWSWALGAFLLGYWLLLEYRFLRLGPLYYYRWDDVARVIQAWRWSRSPILLAGGDWLPLPAVLAGLVLKVLPYPYSVPIQLHVFMGMAVLLLAAGIAARLRPEEPFVAFAAAAGAAGIRQFFALTLSAGAETDLWLFTLAAVYLWTRYRESGRPRWLLAHLGCLILASMTRYEAWLFAAAFLAPAWLECRRRRWPRWGLAAYALAAASAALLFAAAQETQVVPYKRALGFYGLPLSYSGVRLFFRVPNPFTVLSAAAFVRALALAAPLVLGLGMAALWRAAPQPRRWYAPLVALPAAGLAAVGAVFGLPPDPHRLTIVFCLLLSPFFGLACARLARGRGVRVALAAALVGAAYGRAGAPAPGWRRAPGGPASPDHRDSAALARAIADWAAARGAAPRVLFELRGGPASTSFDFLPVRYAVLGDVLFDRRPVIAPASRRPGLLMPPSVFGLPKRKLEAYLEREDVRLIVTCSPAAAAALAGLARPLGRAGSRALFGRNLSASEADFLRGRAAARS